MPGKLEERNVFAEGLDHGIQLKAQEEDNKLSLSWDYSAKLPLKSSRMKFQAQEALRATTGVIFQFDTLTLSHW